MESAEVFESKKIVITNMNLDAYYRTVCESEERLETESQDRGQRYDWSIDFEFDRRKAIELARRDFLGIFSSGKWAQGVQAMVPVKRDVGGEGGRKFDVVHVQAAIDTDKRLISVARWFGCRTDWTQEDFTNEERDYTDIPVLSKKTVLSMLDAYRNGNVGKNLQEQIEEYRRNQEDFVRSHQKKVDFDVAMGKVGGEGDPNFHPIESVQRWLSDMAKRRSDTSSLWTRLISLCEVLQSGEYEQYAIDLDWPEEPTERDVQQLAADHGEKVGRVRDDVRRDGELKFPKSGD